MTQSRLDAGLQSFDDLIREFPHGAAVLAHFSALALEHPWQNRAVG